MNLNLKINTQQYKQEPIKSPRKFTPENHQKFKANKYLQNNQFKNFIRAYRKEVQLPINFQTSIFVSKTPQRCIQHNHIITVYCINDKKPLCIHCMYQIIAHKKHQVIPLSKSNDILKDQLFNLIKNINTNIFPIMTHLIEKNKQNLQKLQNQMHSFLIKINKFYHQITSYLMNTKNEYISKYQHLSYQLKNHYTNFANEIFKIKQYTMQKLKQLQEKNHEENLLFHHNIAMHLSKLSLILSPQLCQYKQIRQIELGNKLDDVCRQIKKLFNNETIEEHLSQKKSSLSPNRHKNTWNPKKRQIYTQAKKQSLSKFGSNPKLISVLTPRQHENSRKKQSGLNFFSKSRPQKQSDSRNKKYFERKSETNRLNFQK